MTPPNNQFADLGFVRESAGRYFHLRHRYLRVWRGERGWWYSSAIPGERYVHLRRACEAALGASGITPRHGRSRAGDNEQ